MKKKLSFKIQAAMENRDRKHTDLVYLEIPVLAEYNVLIVWPETLEDLLSCCELKSGRQTALQTLVLTIRGWARNTMKRSMELDHFLDPRWITFGTNLTSTIFSPS